MLTATRSRTPLTRDQMMRVAPSIFAAAPHDSRSARYTYIPTVNILEGLEREGFEVFEVSQSRARDADRREHTKHMVKLRRGNHIAARPGHHVFVDDQPEVPEVCLVNSHDGTSSYQMFAGLFRLACLNGLIVPVGMVTEIRVPHSGNIIDRVIEGAFSVVEDFDKVRDNANRMKAITLSDGEQRAFARAAIAAKFEPEEGKAAPITEAQVLGVKRHADQGADLWRTFNRVQENLVRGGLRTRTATGRRTSTRAVNGITQNIGLNRALWTLADEMAKLKAA
jgi:hypothetical protein